MPECPLPTIVNSEALCQRVPTQQEKMNRCTDSLHGARWPGSQNRGRVHSFKSTCSKFPKSHPQFPQPLKIMQKIGPCTDLLSDGQKWHASQPTESYSPTLSDASNSSSMDLHLHHPCFLSVTAEIANCVAIIEKLWKGFNNKKKNRCASLPVYWTPRICDQELSGLLFLKDITDGKLNFTLG